MSVIHLKESNTACSKIVALRGGEETCRELGVIIYEGRANGEIA